MKERLAKTAKIIDLSYMQLVFVFVLLVLLEGLDAISLSIDYRFFAVAVALLAVPALLASRRFEAGSVRRVMPLLAAAFVFALLIRVIPQMNSAVFFGYDPGFYKYTFDVYASSLPAIPEEGLAEWIKSMYPQGLFVLFDSLHTVSGIDTARFMHTVFPLMGAMLVFVVYGVTRSVFGQRAGVIAALLYAVSYTQFSCFCWFYFKTVIGILFLLLAIYALEKRKWALMAVMFAAMGVFHRPEFLLFALILIPCFLMQRRMGMVAAAAGAAVLIAPFWLDRWDINWAMLTGVFSTAAGSIRGGEAIGGGTFFGFGTYTSVAVAYLPFALMGAFYLAFKRNWNSIFFYFLINSIIVVFSLFFFKRFIITLDIVFIILAAVGIEYALFRRERLRKAAVFITVCVVVAAAVPTVAAARNVQPLITEGQMEAVAWLHDNTEHDAYVLATSHDAPWVLGWGERRVIAPGLFEWDYHTREEWFDFFAAVDGGAARDFLDVYDAPVYIYYAKNPGNVPLGFEKFENEWFSVVYDEDAIIYKYLGGQ